MCLQHRIQLRFVKASIIVDPSTNDRIEHTRKILNRLVRFQDVSASHGFCGARLSQPFADRRQETDKVLPSTVSWLAAVGRCIPENQTMSPGMFPSDHHPCSRRFVSCPDEAQVRILQTALCNVASTASASSLLLTMHQTIICVARPWMLWIIPSHPLIKHVMKEQVRQQRTDNSALRGALLPLYRVLLPRSANGALSHRSMYENDPATVRMFPYRTHKQFMIDVVEQTLEYQTPAPSHNASIAFAYPPAHHARFARPIPVGVRDESVAPLSVPSTSLTTIWAIRSATVGTPRTLVPSALLRYRYRLYRWRKVRSRRHPIPELVEIIFQILLKLLDRLLIDSRPHHGWLLPSCTRSKPPVWVSQTALLFPLVPPIAG